MKTAARIYGTNEASWCREKVGEIYQNLPLFQGNIRQNVIGFLLMPNIHQIHDIIQKCKCKYIFTEKENLAPPKFALFSMGVVV